jgi:TonB family protein
LFIPLLFGQDDAVQRLGKEAQALYAAKDYAAAKERAEAGAKAGSGDALVVLGQLYDLGNGVPRDNVKSAEFFQRAADAGNREGMHRLGVQRMVGRDVPRDYVIAMSLCRKAADLGSAAAAWEVARMYDNAWGVPRDYTEALRWYKASAEGGYAPGMASTGHMYQVGAGTPRDYAEATRWYQRAVEAGNSSAMLYLGELFDSGHGVVGGAKEVQDSAQAFAWFEKAAKAGNVAAMFRLAMAYEKGGGVQRNHGSALLWAQNAADRNLAEAIAWMKTQQHPAQSSPMTAGEPPVIQPAPIAGDPLARLINGSGRTSQQAQTQSQGEVGGGVFKVGGGVSAPSVLFRVDPQFSKEADRAKFSGTVLLSLIVDAEGKPQDIKVVKALGMGLDEQAIKALQKWKFRPGMKDGKPVSVRAQVEFNFRRVDGPSKPLPKPNDVGPVPDSGVVIGTASGRAALIALYRLRSDGTDESGLGSAFSFSNTSFREGSLYVNGIYEKLPNGHRAVAAVPRLNYLSFTAALDFRAETFGAKNDAILYGGIAYRWWGLGWKDGVLELTLNGGRFRHPFSESLLTEGDWHNVVCSVDLLSKTIRTWLDGWALAEVRLPDDFRLEVLGTNFETVDKNFTFTDYANGTAFQGSVKNLRIYSRAMSATEVQTLYRSIASDTAGNGSSNLVATSDPVYRAGNGVSAPRVLSQTRPEYSDAARNANLSGKVVLDVVVDTQGNFESARVLTSLGLGLDEKAIEAVRQWKFAPGYKDGKPVRVATPVEIDFHVQ